MSIWEFAVIAVLFAVGSYLLMERSLTRVALGVGVIGNGVNVLIIASGSDSGEAPIIGREGELTDPLPQALVLTAIVIGFALLTFLMTLAWRNWTITGNDEVEDDVEDLMLRVGQSKRPSWATRRHPEEVQTMNSLVALPILIPLVAAALMLLVRGLVAQRLISFVALLSSLATATAVLVEVWRTSDVVVSRLGGWPGFVCHHIGVRWLVFGFGGGCPCCHNIGVAVCGWPTNTRRTLAVLPPGVHGARCRYLASLPCRRLVQPVRCFEVLLMASYVLLTLEGNKEQIRSGTTYVVSTSSSRLCW
jgi:multicomponent Na+:H+ antiporter subunit C